jgi:hypothetical protein
MNNWWVHLIPLWLRLLGCLPSFMMNVTRLHPLHLHLYHYLLDSFLWLICGMWFFPINWCRYTLKSYTSDVINLHGFNLLIFTNTWLGSILMSFNSNIALLSNIYCILFSPNHFLVNFPRCDLFPFGNHKTKSLNLNYFLVFFNWFHKTLFHC